MKKNVKRTAQNKIPGQRLLSSSLLILLSVVCCLVPLASYSDDNPLSLMRDDVLSYFRPLKGKVVSVNNGMAVINIGERENVKKGMRFIIFREGSVFLHPVTKAPIGTLEAVIGKAEVKEVGYDTSTAVILKGDVKVSDKVRISETGVRMLFYQGKNVDWSLGDSYYRLIKEAGRFEIVDTAIETDNDSEIIAEAKRLNADVVLILSAKESAGDTMLKHRLLWADNALKFAEDLVGKWLKQYKFKHWKVTETKKKTVTEKMKAKRAKEIAQKLYIGIPTVKKHVSNILKKVQVRSRTEFIARFKVGYSNIIKK